MPDAAAGCTVPSMSLPPRTATGARRAFSPRPPGGLLASLDELALRAGLAAIVAPFLLGLVWWLAGHPFDGADREGDLPRPLFAAAVSLFFLVPMLALAAAGAAVAVVVVIYLQRPPGASAWRALFLVVVAAWAVATAAMYDLVVAPALTR